jgi:peptidyl-prolyl cis-trans isomerase B (cyclophilin B)
LKQILAAALVAAALVACTPTQRDASGTSADNAATKTTSATETTATEPPAPAAQEGKTVANAENKVAVLKTSAGEIHIRFFPDVAPNHVANFVNLAQSGFYDGTKFHRIIPGFMIQGGDPNTIKGDPSSWGTGGNGGNYVKAEFSAVPHKRGIVSMARSQDPNSASSQFFIVVADSNFLDRQYSVFGEVVKGMEVADAIVKAPRGSQDRPNSPNTIQSIEFRDATPDETGPAPK